ncbi:hypothetical protein GOD97_15065 [Paeniclostridium sordellii]|uniref:hypothetical protein n=1 Tax=Paraclostridium sordellii TaxID=1505 RepID=UPI0012EE2CA3|nr:hypothetical protein [Paeniclostridium sordellii]MBS6023480.1 hypothetical protein [Paeniclostridium sordellii]MDU6482541.1 hypothetical protein [Paeniclostridium sordellii]MVO76053.1 hypothetical protein [Paeniclostridium sordellii]
MNWSKKIIVISQIVVIIIGCIVIYNIKNPIVKDLNGGTECINYKGKRAELESFFPDITEAEYLGRTKDNKFKVYTYKNDPNCNLLTLFGSDNTNSYKTKNFLIPTSGNVTKVFINPNARTLDNKIIKNHADIEMFKKLISYKGNERMYHVNNIYTDGTEIYFAYNNCPVTTYNNLVGYIAYINDSWIIVSPKHYLNSTKVEIKNNVDFDLIGRKISDLELIKWLNANRTKVALPSYTEES